MALPVLPVPAANLSEGLSVSDAVAKENSAIEIIKSAFVIPLVIALVMGIGWGAVRWAALRQAESGTPDPQPTVTGPDGSLTLRLHFARLGGELRLREAASAW